MNLEPARHGVPYSAAEDEIIRKHYPGGGSSACLAAGITRTATAVVARANWLGLKRKHRQPDPGGRGGGSTVLMWPLRPHRVTNQLFELAETPGLTLTEYEARKAQILREGNA